MAIHSAFKDKTVIIGDHDEQSLEQIKAVFSDHGFLTFRYALNGDQVFQIIRQFHHQPDDIASVVVNEDLPDCSAEQMAELLESNEGAATIPFIIVKSATGGIVRLSKLAKKSLTFMLTRPINADELSTPLKFIEALKQERDLRHLQEEKLFNELAQRNLIDAKLKYLVAHDELTGLINRNHLEQQLRQSLIHARNTSQDGALLYIDIDRFSLINELEGYDAGDQLIIEVVFLIKKMIKDDAQQLAENIRVILDQHRFTVGDIHYQISVSIGIACIRDGGVSTHPGELISKAHQACYMAKSNGRNKVSVYSENSKLIQERHSDVRWVPRIREAFLEEFFFLEYQPIIDLNDGRITHYEVLIRMQNKDNSVSRPDDFIPAAERMGLIHSIDMWVIGKAINFLDTLSGDQSDLSLSINLSSFAFQDRNLANVIRKNLDISQIDANRITFEITETAAVENFDRARELIAEIRALGCKFALDDFGAGYCSFKDLKKFPVDYIKIDGQFIQNLVNDETDRVLVRSMTEMAHKLGKTTIAEYVESPEVAKILVDMGVNLAQGYLFGKPNKNLLDQRVLPMKEYLPAIH